MNITRRRLLTGGLIAGAALAIAGAVYEWSPDKVSGDPQFRFTMLDDEDRAIVAAIAPVMLAGSLHSPEDVERVVRGTDIAIRGLPLAVRAELRQLFGILRFPPARMLAAGVWHPWHDADSVEISRFLERWRFSGVVQLRSAYDALHQLLMASWYGSDRAWDAIGYPGPPRITS